MYPGENQFQFTLECPICSLVTLTTKIWMEQHPTAFRCWVENFQHQHDETKRTEPLHSSLFLRGYIYSALHVMWYHTTLMWCIKSHLHPSTCLWTGIKAMTGFYMYLHVVCLILNPAAYSMCTWTGCVATVGILLFHKIMIQWPV